MGTFTQIIRATDSFPESQFCDGNDASFEDLIATSGGSFPGRADLLQWSAPTLAAGETITGVSTKVRGRGNSPTFVRVKDAGSAHPDIVSITSVGATAGSTSSPQTVSIPWDAQSSSGYVNRINSYLFQLEYSSTSTPWRLNDVWLEVTTNINAPTNTVLPSIGGRARLGDTLVANTGSFSASNPVTSTVVEWQRNGVTIAGTVGAPFYTVTAADIGQAITIKVTATNQGGSTVANSAPVTGAIANMIGMVM